MKKFYTAILLISVAIFFNSCRKELPQLTDNSDPTDPDISLLDLTIPSDFNYENYKDVTVTFSGFKSTNGNSIKYNIYLYSDKTTQESVTYEEEDGTLITDIIYVTDVLNNLVGTIITSDGTLNFDVNVPEDYVYLYVVRNELGVYSSQIVPIINNKATIVENTENLKYTSLEPKDVLYGVNSKLDLYTINPETGEVVVISQFPASSGGSINCAIDPLNKVLYTIGKSSKHLYSFDLISETWADIGRTNLRGDRLEYRKEDGLLYFSVGRKIQTVDPTTTKVISTFQINGLDNTSLGDIAFDSEGILYVTTKTGLFRCEEANNNTYNAIKINTDKLPFYPSAMAFDSDGTLWIGFNTGNKGRLAVIDKVTGAWEYKFDQFSIRLDDLSSLPIEHAQVALDTDGDGIINLYDEYPNDKLRAYNVYTPSATGLGSYAFEDLWPDLGDFDFNDLVINFRYKHVMNAEGLIHETILDFIIKNVGGSFKNGFGIEINASPDIVQSITGCNLTEGLISVNENGLENNQSKLVFIVFDNAWSNYIENDGKMRVVINYSQPIRNNQIGAMNPFIFINGERGREVHMVDMMPTDLMDTSLFGTGDDDSNPAIGRYYRNQTNLPWGVTMLYDFTFPKEKIAINKGYTKFASWAISSGTDYKDWHKDVTYRNNTYLEN